MVIIQARSKRAASGARYKKSRKKKLYETGSEPTLTKLGERKVVVFRTKGGNSKPKGYRFNEVNVASEGKIKKVKILNVIENPANPHFVRRNILTKGTVIETDIGKARITSTPGQNQIVNAVLIK